MSASDGQMRAMFFKNKKWKLNRCLAPGTACPNRAICSHSVQNARVLDLLVSNGHVKQIRYQLEKDGSFRFYFDDIGRNEASTFEGFCSSHDTSIFVVLDTRAFDLADQEQLFLLAYRSVARELHSVMQGATKVQSAYQDRIALGMDTGLVPEPAGLRAVGHMINAFETWQYKEILDTALLKKEYSALEHITLTTDHEQASFAVSSCFTLEDRPEEKATRISINVFPLSSLQSIVVFSYTANDAERARTFLQPLLDAQGDYQKYLLSKLVLMHCENFVMSPAVFNTWTPEKVGAITSFFRQTLHYNTDADSCHLFLF